MRNCKYGIFELSLNQQHCLDQQSRAVREGFHLPNSRGREQCETDSGCQTLDFCALICPFIQFGSEQVSGSTELLQADAVLSEANTPTSTTIDYSVTMPGSADPAQVDL